MNLVKPKILFSILWIAISFPCATSFGDKEYCRDVFGKINNFINNGFAVDTAKKTFARIDIVPTEKESKEYFRVARMLWKENPMSEDFRDLIKGIEQTGQVPANFEAELKIVRARMKIIRFLCEALCADVKKMSKELDSATKALGGLQDSIKYAKEEPSFIIDAAKNARAAIKKDALNSIEEEIESMAPAAPKDFESWLKKAKRTVEQYLEKDSLSEEQFHEVRKILGRIQTIVLFDSKYSNNREKEAVFAYMKPLYDQIGEQHDAMVSAEWAQKIEARRTGKKLDRVPLEYVDTSLPEAVADSIGILFRKL